LKPREATAAAIVFVLLLVGIPLSPDFNPTIAAQSQSLCTGGPSDGFPNLSEKATDVTSNLSAVANGVSVTEITSPSSGYSASFVYYDTPVYSRATDRIVYYAYPQGGPDMIVTANVDGSDAEVIGQSYANPILTTDGELAIFASPGTTQGTADVYAINLTQPGACARYELLSHDFPQGSNGEGNASYAPVYYYSERDPAADQDLIYIWQYSTIYRVYENGTALPPVTIPNPYGSPWATFHHAKPNPVFPNVVAYLWDQLNGTTGTPETYVVDLDDPSTSYLVFNSTNQGHENWAPDGERLGDADWPYWIVADVLGPDGSILANSTLETYDYPLSTPLYSYFSIERIGPNDLNSTTSIEYAPQYCAWSADSSLLACSSISGQQTGSQYGNKPIYLMYLNGTTEFLASTDSQLLSYWGEPALIFLNDSDHIIYRSDRDGTPQLYEITLEGGLGQNNAGTGIPSSAEQQATGTLETSLGPSGAAPGATTTDYDELLVAIAIIAVALAAITVQRTHNRR